MVQLMHFCTFSSACLYFFPSSLLTPDAPVFVEKQAQGRKKQVHTHTDENIRAGMDAARIGGRQSQCLDIMTAQGHPSSGKPTFFTFYFIPRRIRENQRKRNSDIKLMT